MKMLPRIILLPALLFCLSIFAQNGRPKIKYGDVKPEDFTPAVYSVDSSANAVYLYDVGSSIYQGNNKGMFNVIFHKHARIRLMNKNGFDEATVEIHLYNDGQLADKLEDLDAATYNIENGKVVVTKVDKNSLFKDKGDKEIIQKFTFPNIKEGSIIEYDYKVSSPAFWSIDPWYFQRDYPRIWSEYSVNIPSFYNFITLKQGYLPYVIDSANISKDNYNILDPGEIASDRSEVYSFQSTTFYHLWAVQNMPALKEEGFTTTLMNHISKIEFQLFSIQYPNSPVKPFMQNWYEMAKELMKDESFGEPLTHENNWLNDDVKKAIAGVKDNEGKAKKIFEYVRDNFTCTDNYARYLSQSLKKTYQLHKGNVADINIFLAAMLQNAGFEVHPVLLSTRDHGVTYDMYPIMNKFNYVITQVKSGDKTYFLDASNPDIGFNHLPAECYNGNARIIADEPVLIDLSADSLIESKLTTVFMMNDDKDVSGSFSTQLGNQESQGIRKKFLTIRQEDFFKDIKKSYSMDVELNNTEVDSLKNPEEPVSIKYEMKFNFNEEDVVYFNPVLSEAYKENPFKAAERLYPVEMPSCSDETYILNMEVPKGYKVEELPKSSRVMLNGNEGMFEYIIGESGGRIQLRCRTVIKKANFEPEDYQTLRDFFGFIVKKQAEQIVFKKL
jgi:hypothetical protein